MWVASSNQGANINQECQVRILQYYGWMMQPYSIRLGVLLIVSNTQIDSVGRLIFRHASSIYMIRYFRSLRCRWRLPVKIWEHSVRIIVIDFQENHADTALPVVNIVNKTTPVFILSANNKHTEGGEHWLSLSTLARFEKCLEEHERCVDTHPSLSGA